MEAKIAALFRRMHNSETGRRKANAYGVALSMPARRIADLADAFFIVSCTVAVPPSASVVGTGEAVHVTVVVAG